MVGRVESFQVCCQWMLLSVRITGHYPTTSIYCTEVHLSFWVLSCFRNPPNWRGLQDLYQAYVVILMRERISYVRAYTHWGWAHHPASAQHFLLGKTHKFFLCTWRDSNLWSSNLESDALPVEPPCMSPQHACEATDSAVLWVCD